jgi:hypothetical protein
VTIDPQKAIGTFVFTALDRLGAREDALERVAMYRDPTSIEPLRRSSLAAGEPQSGAAPTDTVAAGAVSTG